MQSHNFLHYNLFGTVQEKEKKYLKKYYDNGANRWDGIEWYRDKVRGGGNCVINHKNEHSNPYELKTYLKKTSENQGLNRPGEDM